MESIIVTLLILAAIGFVAALIVSPKFRLALGIRWGTAVDSMTTDVEKQEALYEAEAKALDEATDELDRVTGTWQHELNVLKGLTDKVTQAETDYNLAIEEKMPQNVVDSRVAAVDAAEQAVADQKKIADGMKTGVDAAKAAVGRAERALKRLETQVKSDAGKARLAEVFAKSASVIERANTTSQNAGEIAKISNKIDERLEQEKAKLDRVSGSPDQQQFEDLSEAARLRKKREELERRRTGGGTTPPAAQ